MVSSPKYRNICFTQNNPSCTPDEFYGAWLAYFRVRYLVFQTEVGEQGTLHYQGYVEFEAQVAVSTICSHFYGIHLESRKGSAAQAAAYCQKDDTRACGDAGPFVFGTLSAPGRRTDLIRIQTMLDSGDSISVVAKQQFGTWCQYYQAFDRYRLMVQPVIPAAYDMGDFNRPPIDVSSSAILLSGPSGFGKTEFADAHFGSKLLVVRHVDDMKKYDAEKHRGMCFHDMDFSHWPITSVIALLDFNKECSLHARYVNVTKPASVPMIFTYNHANPFYTGDANLAQQSAVDRRVVKYSIESRLYGGPMQVPLVPDRNQGVPLTFGVAPVPTYI